jgi:hypothetical protein
LHATGRPSEAKLFYQEALRLDPTLQAATSNLATALHTLGEYQEALTYYQSAINNSLGNAILLTNYAICLSTLNYHMGAYKTIEKAVVLDPNDAAALAAKIGIQQTLQREIHRKQTTLVEIQSSVSNRDWAQALSQLVSYGEPVEDSAWWYYAVGMTQFFRGEYQNSLEFCQRAQSSLSSPSHLVLGCIAGAEQYLDNNEAAVKYFELTYTLLQQDGYRDSLPFLSFVMNKGDVEYNLLQALYQNKDYEKGLDLSLRVLSLPPIEQGGVIILLFSLVKWSDSAIGLIDQFGQQEVDSGGLVLPPQRSLHDEVGHNVSTICVLYDLEVSDRLLSFNLNAHN